jgi:hypothetical protein
MEWPLIIAGGVLITGLLGLVFNNSSKYFTIREHIEFKAAVFRELDVLRDQIKTLEQTRPTTGELLARIQSNVHRMDETLTNHRGQRKI